MEEFSIESFAANVGRRCAERGDIQAVADAAGIGRVMLSRIIHGHRAPSLDVAIRIAIALDTDLSTLASKPSGRRQARGRAS